MRLVIPGAGMGVNGAMTLHPPERACQKCSAHPPDATRLTFDTLDCATGCLPSQSKGCGTPVSKGGARASGEGFLPAADWGAGRDASLPTDASGECGRVGTAREGRGRRPSRVLLLGTSEWGSRLSRIRQKGPADASPRNRVGTKS